MVVEGASGESVGGGAANQGGAHWELGQREKLERAELSFPFCVSIPRRVWAQLCSCCWADAGRIPRGEEGPVDDGQAGTLYGELPPP